jgi:glutathione synthase/RimK-type ligase-like ATP-grasp enzyme
MILVMGSSSDRVYPKLMQELRKSGAPFEVLDEDDAARYRVESDVASSGNAFRIFGAGCSGMRPVGSIFVRHAVSRALDPDATWALGALQASLNRMLLAARCPTINPPVNSISNYSKPYQLRQLADAGFDVPRTLVTNMPQEALRFREELAGKVIFKGVSNVMSLAQLLTAENLDRLGHLPNSPTQFQEYVEGVDYRVHVVGEEVFVTRLVAPDEDYRRSSLIDRKTIVAEPASLPDEVTGRCVRFTKQLGLVVSGLDFKESRDGRLVALGLNPLPQFTFYEGYSGQPITRSVVELLSQHQWCDSNVYA